MATVALLSQLLSGYDPFVRPTSPLISNPSSCSSGGGPATVVTTQFVMSSMHSINDKERSYFLEGYLNLEWNDPRLRFGTASCLESITLPSYQSTNPPIWQPEIHVMEALHESIGGGAGALAALGESMTIIRNGTVIWSRRTRMKLLCDTFSFARLPYDVQHCMVTFRSYPYKVEDVELTWHHKSSAPPYHTGEWVMEVVGRRSVLGADGHNNFRLCVQLSRHSNLLSVAMVLIVLLVIAAYCSFFIPVGAAPARVAISFLTFLMLLNKLFFVLGHMPLLMEASESYNVWMSDFLMGSMLLCWFTLIEYALVHIGLKCQAQLAEKEKAEPDPSAVNLEQQSRTDNGSGRRVDDRISRALSRFAHIDCLCRWVYPPVYILFAAVMYASIDAYEGTACKW